MLERFELLFAIIGGWIVSIIFYIILKQKRGDRLPSGSIVFEAQNNEETDNSPGYSIIFLIGIGSTSFSVFFIVFLCIFDFWNILAPYIAIDFPRWLNWLGIIGIWIQDAWGIAILLYNVNYTPAYKSMKNKYVLATGGPYKLVRHPMYIAKAFLMIFVFLATGLWLTLIGILTWIALPTQAAREEEALHKKFGEIYENYCKRTGRFFPKIKKL